MSQSGSTLVQKAVVKSASMPVELQRKAVELTAEALQKYQIEKDIAIYLKKTFDELYGPRWHCIVGRNFGSYVAHADDSFIFFFLGNCAVLLFKSS